ncbi:MarR family winged helix-turn-helix transcriptional regulator [Crenobacter cavernae]|uniref:MarR family transcriptional regulator n=1 Tax=Crenobacter cavernae TaxID=2290923 RepID=A0A345Y2P1_9NEIS|nr:MarR family transcriptional regulator [Crenobacter cavernae]AXK38193.1 MarR family transcriptional regulator [Crenobacter cavernae]
MLDVNKPAPSAETDLRAAMEHFFFAYQAFTAKPDEILERRGLARVHHRVLFFLARHPGQSVKALLATLNVSKQALNMPLRQLIEMGLVNAEADPADKRMKRLFLSAEGAKLEATLYREQARLLETALERAGCDAATGWHAFNHALSPPPDEEAP